MDLATGYTAHTLQTNDAELAARINEQRRIALERSAEQGDVRPTLLHRLADRLHLHTAHTTHASRAAHASR
ncbi:hypothetical protein [Agromyces neolithicus]|uniref:Uncharacterized protein n=1 Tax=Agromyces neolithicus TaxID=269420 RepID=A0ABN2M8R4_9MICO